MARLTDKVVLTHKQAVLIKEVVYMGYLWGQSLIDADVANGKKDTKTATMAYQLLSKKISKIKK
jgi:hypothetical protein